MKIIESSETHYYQNLKSGIHEYGNDWFDIYNVNTYYTLQYKGLQTAILPIVDEAYVLMVKVKRELIGLSTWELPAGGVSKNEAPVQAAQRELKEETGVSIEDYDRFLDQPSLIVSPNRMPMYPLLFKVNITRTEFDARNHHDHEIEEVALFSFSEVKRMIANDEIIVLLPLAVISRYLLSL